MWGCGWEVNDSIVCRGVGGRHVMVCGDVVSVRHVMVCGDVVSVRHVMVCGDVNEEHMCKMQS